MSFVDTIFYFVSLNLILFNYFLKTDNKTYEDFILMEIMEFIVDVLLFVFMNVFLQNSSYSLYNIICYLILFALVSMTLEHFLMLCKDKLIKEKKSKIFLMTIKMKDILRLVPKIHIVSLNCCIVIFLFLSSKDDITSFNFGNMI